MNSAQERKDIMNTQKNLHGPSTSTSEPEIACGETQDSIKIIAQNQSWHLFDRDKLRSVILWACQGYEEIAHVEMILQEVMNNIYDGISVEQIADALILSLEPFIEKDPLYSKITARLLQKKLFKEVTGFSIRTSSIQSHYYRSFIASIQTGVDHGLYDSSMLDFDLQALAHGLCPERDSLFEYMGLRTLYERYFTILEKKRIELPQIFWMRVAMGLALHETHKTEKVLEFYHVFSKLYYVPSTPTLLHAGLKRAQLSSCFLSTVEDDLHHIFKCIGDNAQLSKWSGGVSTDWTNIRAIGAPIESIKVESQGLIPFLRIANDTTAAINRSGKRRSASVVYLEIWHYEVEDFLDLRKNTGDERRRTHDINTAVWIPDLFMKRVREEGDWTLFSPDEVPDLHHIYGKAFEERYRAYEALAAATDSLRLSRTISAAALWRKLLSRLFETGHPWITFKDPSNIRSPQDHAGVVHCSNLCTEITLNTSAQETAVCNLGSINIGQHIVEGTLDVDRLASTVKTAMRMLDNVIDICFYPTIEAKNANMNHRPVGLGQMGLQDALYMLDISFHDQKALEFADYVTEVISYYAILSSSELAKERGVYNSYFGSKWHRNIFPHDTLELLEQERGMKIPVPRTERLDWKLVREHVKKYGMRNSNCMAIAPTATISNIAGCIPCIEPIYKNLYVKSNMSGEFTVVNKYLVEDLKKEKLWNQEMLDMLKYFDGSVQHLPVPHRVKDKYKEAFEIDPLWLAQITAYRGRWIDQSQSHNVFMKGVSGKKLSDIYMFGWEHGMKTFYYLRTLGASQIEKSTLDAKKFGFTQKRNYQTFTINSTTTTAHHELSLQVEEVSTDMLDRVTDVLACSIENPECDACQ